MLGTARFRGIFVYSRSRRFGKPYLNFLLQSIALKALCYEDQKKISKILWLGGPTVSKRLQQAPLSYLVSNEIERVIKKVHVRVCGEHQRVSRLLIHRITVITSPPWKWMKLFSFVDVKHVSSMAIELIPLHVNYTIRPRLGYFIHGLAVWSVLLFHHLKDTYGS